LANISARKSLIAFCSFRSSAAFLKFRDMNHSLL
jgi:hypothetical protein